MIYFVINVGNRFSILVTCSGDCGVETVESRQKWRQDTNPHKVGDLVLLVDQLLPHNQWSMGRIV